MVRDHPRDETGRWARALDTTSGRAYWRSARDLLASAEFREAVPSAVTGAALAGPDGMSRRDLLRLMGASFALAGLVGCNIDPDERILPYANRPPEVTPGLPRWYATSMVLDGFATGLLVQSYEGRPTKVEGNPQHPASLGSTGVFEQASVLQLYDPDRMGAVERRGRRSTWSTFARDFVPEGTGEGLRFLLYPQSSPHIGSLIERVRARYPGARFCFDSPFDRREVYRATQQLFGRPVEPQYDFARAAVVLALDADFTAAMPNAVRWARDFASARRLADPSGQMNRLYAVETAPTPTSSLADHRLPVAPSEVGLVAAAVLAEIAADGGGGQVSIPGDLRAAIESAAQRAGHPDWVDAVARDLRARGGAGIVIAGDRQPAEVHALAHLLNLALGNVGTTVQYSEPALVDTGLDYTLSDLVGEMRQGTVEHLVILEANPSYTAPVDLEFSRWLRQVPNTAALALYADETVREAAWALPATHYLESWGDARSYDGTHSIVQPLIRPLYGGRTTAEILALFTGEERPSGYDLLREDWRQRLGGGFDEQWEAILQAGLVAGSEAPRVDVQPEVSGLGDAVGRLGDGDVGGLELNLERSPAMYDGRFANIGWLQEFPDPTTKLTWDNAALVSPRTARELAVRSEDVVELRRGDSSVRAPVLVVPGHADRAVTLHLGWGRQGAETLARGRGVNAYRLRSVDEPRSGGALEATSTGERYPLAITQRHQELHDRPIALHALLAEYREHPEFTEELRGPVASLLPEYHYPEERLQWAMSIDTSICTGCSACVVACQAENNVPVVGKEGVRNSREMHWLRIDRYRADDGGVGGEGEVINQPMLCQHCEKAPCEYVCPVNATVHSPDGLNEMVYNRCVGTRFCSNNCPYKIRRFNWFSYDVESPLKLQRNPQVTIRERGVMEKCTYCVQRIRRAGIQANIENRELRPGEVMTACQQACPTRAIQFDALQHEDTEMVKWRRQPRMYEVLHEEGTRPRNAYLAKIRNPNEDLE